MIHCNRWKALQKAMQKTTIQGLEQLWVTYRAPVDIDRDQGIHFTGHDVQQWANNNDTHWHLYLPYDPTAARLIQRVD